MKRSINEVVGSAPVNTLDSDNAKKPVFLTKAQREESALKRREDAISEQRLRREQLGPSTPETEDANGHRSKDRERDREQDRDRERHRGDRDRDRDRERERHRDRDGEIKRDLRERERGRRERDREPDRRIRDREREEEEAKAREKAVAEKLVEREREKELDAIKEQYLGGKKPKKRVTRPSEKFRFSFDWENTEDTSRDMKAHEAQLLFGRGFRAGMDRREQKKQAAKHEKEARDEIRRKDGVVERPEETAARKEREEAADTYDPFDMRVDRHWSDKRLEEMTERDWRIFREDFNISYKGSRIPRPMRSWEESQLSSELLEAVENAKYKKPSPIQMAAIPLGLQQRDVIGIAQTGSGKTAAFVLPMLAYISRLPPMSEENKTEGPYAVVMAPTQELAEQIEKETAKLARCLKFRVTCIVGGKSIEKQALKMTQGCEIVVATPGRLIDCLERRYVVLNQCNYVVLDEADRMIDMGFEPQVAGVLDAMPSSNLKPANEEEELDGKKIYRTTYMFSATMPPEVERLARKYLRNPVKLLDELGDKKIAIVFVNTRENADSIAKNLDKAGYGVTSLHGGKSKGQRDISLEGFRAKRYNVLVATNVAARGLDISDVAHVINYDMPECIEMYTHRIGRTGRAGKTGIATSFLTLRDTQVFYDLKQMLVQSNSPVPPELDRHEASRFKPGTIPDRPPRHCDTVYIN
ncbi:unnamed protein product [Thlaspi arvense]|uniref:DEAD-box ATP-dependent RNA helicase 21 n=1 Tax=Thlaspi arvense TaxID=13288 RepID=A0AAU9SJV2_THLAR|nr:unnamed protein product [Thlaspi arvense]